MRNNRTYRIRRGILTAIQEYSPAPLNINELMIYPGFSVLQPTREEVVEEWNALAKRGYITILADSDNKYAVISDKGSDQINHECDPCRFVWGPQALKTIILTAISAALLATSAGCSTIDAAVMNMRDKAVSDQMVVDGVYVTTMNPMEAKATPEVKAGHIQRDYTGVPVMKGQPIQIIKRNYSLFFGQLISEIQVTVMAPSDGVLKFNNDAILELKKAKPVTTLDKLKP